MSEIIINLPPISLNNAYYRNRQLTKEAREYRSKFLLELMKEENQVIINNLKDTFDKLKYSLHVDVTFLLPKSSLFTKKGYISRASKDLDNCLKLPLDFLCNKKYIGRIIEGTKINNLGIDDQFITSIKASKELNVNDSDMFSTLIKISLVRF